MAGVKPTLEMAGAKYLARGGVHKVYEGDWEPRRIVLLECPSVAAWESFYHGPTYQGLKTVRDALQLRALGRCGAPRLNCLLGSHVYRAPSQAADRLCADTRKAMLFHKRRWLQRGPL